MEHPSSIVEALVQIREELRRLSTLYEAQALAAAPVVTPAGTVTTTTVVPELPAPDLRTARAVLIYADDLETAQRCAGQWGALVLESQTRPSTASVSLLSFVDPEVVRRWTQTMRADPTALREFAAGGIAIAIAATDLPGNWFPVFDVVVHIHLARWRVLKGPAGAGACTPPGDAEIPAPAP